MNKCIFVHLNINLKYCECSQLHTEGCTMIMGSLKCEEFVKREKWEANYVENIKNLLYLHISYVRNLVNINKILTN